MGIISPLGVDSRGNPLTTGHLKQLGKDDFLQLLVTKLKYQDPMEPMSDEAFIAELAQFSSLEQLQNLNNALDSSLRWDFLQMQTINNTMATSLIGRDVRANFSNVYLDDGNLPKIGFTTSEHAASVRVTITDFDGNVVRTLTEENIAAGNNSIVWDGKDEYGERLSQGYYQIEMTAYDSEGKSFTPSTFLEGRVTGVVYRDGAAYLKVNGLEIPLADVTAIDEAEKLSDNDDDDDDDDEDNNRILIDPTRNNS